MSKYLDSTGLSTLWAKIKNTFVAKETGKGLSTNDYTTAEKTKLGGVATGAEVNQNAFASVSDGTNTVSASSKTDTLTIVGGGKTTVSYSPTDKKLTISSVGTTEEATQSANGLMSSADKTKLDGFGAASTYALKSDITNVYKYKGSVATISDLPSTNNVAGDVYNVEERGINYAWTGSAWDALGELFSIESIENDTINALS